MHRGMNNNLKIIDSLEQKGSINTSEIILIFPLTYSESRNYDQDKSRIITYLSKN